MKIYDGVRSKVGRGRAENINNIQAHCGKFNVELPDSNNNYPSDWIIPFKHRGDIRRYIIQLINK